MGFFSFGRRAPVPKVLPASLRLAGVDWSRQNAVSARTGSIYRADYYFFIDIVGACNLRCPSCPVGNTDSSGAPKGLMQLSMYQAILKKIALEHEGEEVFIDLYNWGESPIHPELPKFISATRSAGYGCGISSNFNAVVDMKGMVKANPSYIRISLSGASNDIYQQTHRGGNVFEVKANMYRLRAMLDRYKSEIPVQVGYHVYNHNAGEEYDKMAELCGELGFLFSPAVGILQPLEKALSAISSGTDKSDAAVVDLMIVKPREWKTILQSVRNANTDCIHRRARTTINYDGSVPLCCYTYSAENRISTSFLDTARTELERRKYEAATCGKCASHNLDLMITGVRSREASDLLNARLTALRAAEGLSMEHVTI